MPLVKLILFFISITYLTTVTLADTYNEKRKFNIYAKLPILPKIAVMEINTSLIVNNNDYFYEFNIESKNIVDFINQVDGQGTVIGKINDYYRPTKYEYKYVRKNKEKFVRLTYDDNNVSDTYIKPKINKSELTPIKNEMLFNTIDPSTFFLNVLGYQNISNCEATFRIFDGKRRYDVIFDKFNVNEKTNNIECEASQKRLGGYKIDEKEKDIFASSDYIKIIYENNSTYDFIGYEAKNGNIKIIIEEIK